MNNKLNADIILELQERWERADKNTIMDNVEHYICAIYPECALKWSAKIHTVSELTDSKTDAVYAWFNRGRENVKIPFLKLCKLATSLNVDIENFLIHKGAKDNENN